VKSKRLKVKRLVVLIFAVIISAKGVLLFAQESQETAVTATEVEATEEAESTDSKESKSETTEKKASSGVLVSDNTQSTATTKDTETTTTDSISEGVSASDDQAVYNAAEYLDPAQAGAGGVDPAHAGAVATDPVGSEHPVPGEPYAPEPAMAEAPPATTNISPSSSSGSSVVISDEELSDSVQLDQEKISLDLKGIDIHELFRMLSLKMGITIVPTKNVSGRINIFLNNLTFEDALDVILISQDLAAERDRDIINIMTSAEYERLYGRKFNERREFSDLKLRYAKPSTVFSALAQIKSDIGKVIVDEGSGTILMIDIPEKLTLMEETARDLDKPPKTEIFDINYAKSADMKTHLTSALTTGPGEVFVDERSSKVVVTDLPEKMKKIKSMVRAFDAETKQVYIEAEILQLTLKKEYQRQINWEKAFKQKWLENLDFVGTFPVAASFTPSPALATASLQAIHGVVATDWHTETVKFLETFGDTKIISSPRLAVINNQEAKILVGAREAYVTTSQSQAETTTVTSENVEFIDVGTKLNIVPTINEDGYITMKIKPEVSSVRETLTTSLGSSVPIVETSEVETVVKVKDGQTILIAGLVKEEKRADKTGWPVLNSIPILGVFFGSRADLDKRTETIILITPHIIRGDKAIPGTEVQDLLPADIVTEDLEKSIVSTIISKEIEEANIIKRREILPENETMFRTPIEEQLTGKSTIEIQGKFKGLKEYQF